MKFPIVTISYNQARFLEEAVLFPLNQGGVDVDCSNRPSICA